MAFVMQDRPGNAPAAPPPLGIVADELQCALQDRLLGLHCHIAPPCWRALYLSSGTCRFVTGDDERIVDAPAVLWSPWTVSSSLSINAGAVGYTFTVDDDMLRSAVGVGPKAVDLHRLAERGVIARLEEAADLAGDVQNVFRLIVRELQNPDNGSEAMLHAQICVLLVIISRTFGAEEIAQQSHGVSSQILLRFRQLVELHFRDRWTIADYARATGISHDRLHDICTRKLGKTPSVLVGERVTHEARRQLERSTLTVEQIAGSLGFRDTSHFSRFFKKAVGMPPARYRTSQSSEVEGPYPLQNNFSDWP